MTSRRYTVETHLVREGRFPHVVTLTAGVTARTTDDLTKVTCGICLADPGLPVESPTWTLDGRPLHEIDGRLVEPHHTACVHGTPLAANSCDGCASALSSSAKTR